MLKVAQSISGYFFRPVFRVRFHFSRPVDAFAASVPKATVNEYRDASRRKDDVRFTPHTVPANDPLKLAVVEGKELDECALAVKALRRVAKHVDVDKVMIEDPVLLEVMTKETSQLLEVARYDTVAYAAWVALEG
jgi:hypothetical protein